LLVCELLSFEKLTAITLMFLILVLVPNTEGETELPVPTEYPSTTDRQLKPTYRMPNQAPTVTSTTSPTHVWNQAFIAPTTPTSVVVAGKMFCYTYSLV
jgi:hypothetical protein